MLSPRKKLAIGACLLFGPLFCVASVLATYKDYVFLTRSEIVEGKIVGKNEVRSTKGPDKVRFFVDFRNAKGEMCTASLTVYDYQRDDYLSRNPLKLRYLESSPDTLRPEDFFPQGWIGIPLGAIMFVIGYRSFRKYQGAT